MKWVFCLFGLYCLAASARSQPGTLVQPLDERAFNDMNSINRDARARRAALKTAPPSKPKPKH